MEKRESAADSIFLGSLIIHPAPHQAPAAAAATPTFSRARFVTPKKPVEQPVQVLIQMSAIVILTIWRKWWVTGPPMQIFAELKKGGGAKQLWLTAMPSLYDL